MKTRVDGASTLITASQEEAEGETAFPFDGLTMETVTFLKEHGHVAVLMLSAAAANIFS